MPKNSSYLSMALSGHVSSRIFKNCNGSTEDKLNCFFNIPRTIPSPKCKLCCDNDSDLLTVPTHKLHNLGLTYRDIATELCLFKNSLLTHPISLQYLSNPYNQTYETVVSLDRLWARLAQQRVNDTTNTPEGYGKRILFCANDGNVFIDVSTFIPNTKWMNFSIVALNKKDNIDEASHTFNYEETDWSSVNTNVNTQSSKFTILKCGSPIPHPADPDDLSPQSTVATSFIELDPHTTRKEILQTISNPYGWASRYSETVFTPSFYVATKLEGEDGYSIFIVFSYFLIN